MLVIELLDYKGPHQSAVDAKTARDERAGRRAPLGTGQYATVFDQPHDTNSVMKVGRFANDKAENDGYYAFLTRIAGMDNPFFPQVDELTTLRNRSSGLPYYKVRMEKLTPLKELSVPELMAMWEKMFGEEPHVRVMPGDTPHEELLFMLTMRMSKLCDMHKPMKMERGDPNLKQAIRMLAALSKDGYNEDLNSENMMVRRTPYGAQLVFTDPFTTVGKSRS